MIEVTAPAVVNIAVRGTVTARRDPMMEEFRRFFGSAATPAGSGRFKRRRAPVSSSTPSKATFSPTIDVVENADEITVTLLDDRSLDAESGGLRRRL